MPDLSDEKRTERQQGVDFARGSAQLSGGELDSEVEALNARYIAGELSGDEHVAAVIAHARSSPKGEPVEPVQDTGAGTVAPLHLVTIATEDPAGAIEA